MLSQSISSLGWFQIDTPDSISDWMVHGLDLIDPQRHLGRINLKPRSSKELIPMFEVDFSSHLYFYS